MDGEWRTDLVEAQMPYCSSCGSQASDGDLYCRSCGARQSAARAAGDALSSLSPRTASLLCYIPFVGWILAIVVLASERFRADRTVRFHAFQGLYLFVAWLIVHWVIAPLSFLHRARYFDFGDLFELAMIGVGIFMLIKVSQGQNFSLPILGELAEKSVSES
jgi:uncharacterized membrane protein